jgi:para-aminobenzoate synthetase/4-amino-4-deoxychorismate lyase
MTPTPARPDPKLGVFETLLVADGQVHALEAHLERLGRSLRELYDLPRPARLGAELEAEATQLSGRHRLRVDARPDGQAVAIELTTSALAPGPPAGVVCAPVFVSGGWGKHKWSDRRSLDALTTPDSVPVFVDRDGCLLEATWANLWLREVDRLITPPADGRLLPGVTRARLIGLAPGLGFTVAQEPISLARASEASEMFLTSSLRLAVPATMTAVTEPRTATLPPHPSPALDRIRAALSG